MGGYLFAIDRDLHPASFRHIKDLCGALARKGFDCALLAFTRDTHGPGIREQNQDGVTLVECPKSRLGMTYSFRGFYRTARRFRPFCFVANFDVAYPLIIFAGILNIPCRVIWERGLSTYDDWGRESPVCRKKRPSLWKRAVFASATRFIGISQAVVRDLHKNYSVPQEKIRLFYNLLADPLEGDSALKAVRPEPGRILCPARVWAIKGQDVLIRALAKLKRRYPNLTVQFAGGGGMRPYCRDLALKLGLDQNCYFSGKLSHGEILKEMARSWLTVLPSRDEAFGRVIIESMALGTPVVASRAGGVPELFTDGREGFLVPPENPDALAEKIEILLSNSALRGSMSGQGRAHYLERFELSKLLPEQTEIFLKMTEPVSR